MVSLLAVVLVASGCGGGKTTTSSIPPTTSTNPPTSTTNPPTTTTTTPPPSTGTLPETAPAITTHSKDVLAAYKGLCLPMCHGPGTANQFPLPPAWNGKTYGSTHNTGVYTITTGSNADHTGRTEDLCTTKAGCHAAPK